MSELQEPHLDIRKSCLPWKKSLNSSIEGIFAIVDRITNIINSELLMPALAFIFCMGKRLQKEKFRAGEKNALKNTMYSYRQKTLTDNMITLCRGKYQTLKACLILKEDIITPSSLKAHSKVCIFELILLLLLLTILQRPWSCLYLMNTLNAFLKEQSNKTFGAELYQVCTWYEEGLR